MIEFKGKVIKDYPYHAFDVYIDNQLFPEINATQAYNKPKYDLSIHSKGMEEKIFSYPIDYFIPDVNKLVFWGYFSLLNDKYFESNVEIEIHENINVESTVSIDIMPNVSDWNLNFSINDYIGDFFLVWEEIQKRIQPFDIFDWNLDKHAEDYQISISNDFHMYFSGETLKQILSPLFALVKECHETTLNILEPNNNHPEIIGEFNFPEELKIPCEQYLLSFIQFLHDLGTNAASNLKEEAGKVLFSVTPTDDIEALDKIREALAIYLSLSSNPILHSTGDRAVDMVLSGVRANAKHLESQLELAIAKLQFKEATLELKDATIEQNQLALRQRDDTIKDLKEMLARGNIFEESLEKIVINGEIVEETSLYRFSQEDDIEVEATLVLDENNQETRIGLVKFHEVTKLKDYGVSVDLPKAIRDLMDYFKRDKNSR